jgi:hypothetical protein
MRNAAAAKSRGPDRDVGSGLNDTLRFTHTLQGCLAGARHRFTRMTQTVPFPHSTLPLSTFPYEMELSSTPCHLWKAQQQKTKFIIYLSRHYEHPTIRYFFSWHSFF